MIDTPFEFLNNKTDSLSPLPLGGVGGRLLSWCVILASGEPLEHDIPVQLLQEAPYVVCCDSAILQCDWADAVVGDGDSIPSWAREEYDDIFVQVDEQDDNDLTKATRFCLEKGFRRIVYLGATGRREDHTLGNISLLMRYAREFDIEPLMATNYGWFVPGKPTPIPSQRGGGLKSHLQTQKLTEIPPSPSGGDGGRLFSSFPGQQVSLFNFGCTQLRTHGLRYDGYPFTSWWQGTLNEATGDSFTIEADGDYLVYRTYEAKR